MANPNGIGASVRRLEDQRFLTGRGRYTDDFKRPDMTHAVHVRSPYAHALVKGIDATEALAAPGVVAVLTGADMEADKVGSLPCGWQIHSKDGSPMKEPGHFPLARGRVRYVGDAVAVVIAETREQARDAAELVMVDYEELPAVASSTRAVEGAAALVHDDAPGNVCFDWHLGDKAAVDAAFARAEHVARIDLVNNRLVPNAMEPRAALGEYDASNGEYTLTTTSQNPHVIRLLMGAFVLGIPEHKLRVVAPDVGGGFGSKIFHYGEEAVVTWAARKIGRPVKWTADRSESFLTDAHGRDHVSHAEMAMDKDGRFLALRVSTLANLGAYLSTFAPSIPTYLYATLLAGQYKTPAIYAEVKAVFTNTAPVDAYRGAGRPEACYLIERLVDIAAGVAGLDRTEIRRRNFVPAEAMPYQTPVALQYDTGDFAKNLDIALPLVDYDGFAARKAASRATGKLRGIGFATYIEACGIAPSNVAGALGARAGLYESAEVRFHPTGSVTVFTGSHSHGQGHETTFAQLVAERFGVPIENVEIVHGDTAKIPFGMGTYGSRSLAVGGSALVKAMDKVERKARKIAAHMLEAAESDIEVKEGRFTVAGTDKSLGIGDIALQAYVPHNFPLDELEPGLDEQAFYDPKNFTYPNGCHVCEVEIDPDTGVTKVVAFAAVDDFGRIINPLVVEGQVHGGLVQGIGQALYENCVYDESGQLLTGSYMDYCMPRAEDVPSFTVRTHEDQPCTHNPLGVKGCGEAGTIGASAAVMNAVVDALSAYGVTHLDMPATPEKVWRVIQAARPAPALAAE
ncbi:xanthine dehydrogenase family protein molybdopterin-binding subunit [Azospirillum doebereinerae]|uniref:Xanthine dehydrogenase family protein molybdopterin-binding subunit n=1 Tax=Azospirillum doebereinerae TaxID=92933 RepID=A0A3S0XKZ8_9PROT|nr:xanthine dehydrogenase family protein molybdopterin-binding subunit [Azospirillum doebereinerae]MCG5242645.1 xanthine dehydrogenase family protein molybdopterin-binding subunit [Azospirillum doebereinerae]RUQ67612.1 xanthine dehydrogenase family protein molybdopterin-binding subunit [Azospirillum doebereinerae]